MVKPELNQNGVIRNDGIIMDARNRSVKISGKTFLLTKHEYKLFRLFVTNLGSPVSRERIIRHLGPKESDLNFRTVDTSLCRLRKKLKKYPNSPVTLTSVRGIGYRLEA